MAKYNIFIMFMVVAAIMHLHVSAQEPVPGEPALTDPAPAEPEPVAAPPEHHHVHHKTMGKFGKEYHLCMKECMNTCNKGGTHHTDCEISCDEDCTKKVDADMAKYEVLKVKKLEKEQDKEEEDKQKEKARKKK